MVAALPAKGGDVRGFDGKWTGGGKMTQGGVDCHPNIQLVLNIVGMEVKGDARDDEGSIPISGTINDEGRMITTGFDEDIVVDIIGTVHDTIMGGTRIYRGVFCSGVFNIKKVSSFCQDALAQVVDSRL
jgi:hypothetical protein